MRRLRPLLAVALLFVLAFALTACGGTGADNAEPISDESPVPEGMPVMYEFFTDT